MNDLHRWLLIYKWRKRLGPKSSLVCLSRFFSTENNWYFEYYVYRIILLKVLRLILGHMCVAVMEADKYWLFFSLIILSLFENLMLPCLHICFITELSQIEHRRIVRRRAINCDCPRHSSAVLLICDFANWRTYGVARDRGQCKNCTHVSPRRALIGCLTLSFLHQR